IEEVALVQDRVGDLAGQLEGGERGVAHGPASRASLNSASRASSQVGRARTALKRCRASRVSRRTRAQPDPGKKGSMISRHTETGSRYTASLCHGTWPTEKPPGPLVNTVPLNSNSSGTSPSPRACRYLDAATSKSEVQGTGRSTS